MSGFVHERRVIDWHAHDYLVFSWISFFQASLSTDFWAFSSTKRCHKIAENRQICIQLIVPKLQEFVIFKIPQFFEFVCKPSTSNRCASKFSISKKEKKKKKKILGKIHFRHFSTPSIKIEHLTFQIWTSI